MFMMRDVVAGSIISFYNGVKLSKEECEEPSEDWRDDAYKILDQRDENVLDIPAQYQDTTNYRATLAHKTNHSFTPNTKFCPFFHPRFGHIPALRTVKNIAAGAEVLVNYEYSFDSAPPWYQQQNIETILQNYSRSRY